MTVCKFWLEGRCRYGNNCKFEHPPRGGGFQSQGQTQNRFAALEERVNDNRPSGNTSGAGRGAMNRLPYQLDRETLIDDLAYTHPQWLLSAYGPGRDAPIQLFGGGMREQSFEEMRLYHYQESAQGRQQQAMQGFNDLMNRASQQMQTTLRDPDGALHYIIAGENEHPNRLDLCSRTITVTPGPPGQGGFGQPSAPAAGGMTFGMASKPGAGGTSPFGQPSQLQPANPPFGRPSQPTQQPNTFGQPSQLAGNRFGVGSAAPVQNAFGHPQSTGFGQPQSGVSGFGQPQNNPSGFGRPAFGQLSQPARSGQLPQATRNSSSSSMISPFSTTEQSTTSSSGFPRTSTESTMGAGSSSPWDEGFDPEFDGIILDTGSYSTRDPSTNKLLTWKGKSVEYADDEPCFRRDDDGKLEKIWFPDGPPPPNPDTELPIEMYDERTREAYLYLKRHGVFKDGWIPTLPPRREWVRWDL